MAGDINIKHGAATSYTGLTSALGSGSTTVGDAINVTTNDPVDVLVEFNIDPGITTANMQAVIYAVSSLDGTNYSDSTNYSTNAAKVGVIRLPDTTALRSRAFSVAQAFGGTLPPYFKILVHNDSGAAFASMSAQYVEVEAQYT